jgi:hypothetical protein
MGTTYSFKTKRLEDVDFARIARECAADNVPVVIVDVGVEHGNRNRVVLVNRNFPSPVQDGWLLGIGKTKWYENLAAVEVPGIGVQLRWRKPDQTAATSLGMYRALVVPVGMAQSIKKWAEGVVKIRKEDEKKKHTTTVEYVGVDDDGKEESGVPF